MNNPNSQLDPQNAMHNLAHIAPNEMPAEAIDHVPDPFHDEAAYERADYEAQRAEDDHLEAAYEARTEIPDCD